MAAMRMVSVKGK